MSTEVFILLFLGQNSVRILHLPRNPLNLVIFYGLIIVLELYACQVCRLLVLSPAREGSICFEQHHVAKLGIRFLQWLTLLGSAKVKKSNQQLLEWVNHMVFMLQNMMHRMRNKYFLLRLLHHCCPIHWSIWDHEDSLQYILIWYQVFCIYASKCKKVFKSGM